MQVTGRPVTSSETETGSCNFEIIQEFKYLGKMVTSDKNMDRAQEQNIT
jgi:hypothetical protein